MSLQIYFHLEFTIIFLNEAETHSTGLGGFSNEVAMMWGKTQKEQLCILIIFANGGVESQSHGCTDIRPPKECENDLVNIKFFSELPGNNATITYAVPHFNFSLQPQRLNGL